MTLNQLISNVPDCEDEENLCTWFIDVEKWAQQHGYKNLQNDAHKGKFFFPDKQRDKEYRLKLLSALKSIRKEEVKMDDRKRVFIVHGHDEALREQVKSFLKDQGIEPIILSERANNGKTIIEKLESESDGVKYAVILYTPDDSTNIKSKKRARQNVIFEHGYFTAKLGRQNVCVIMSDNVEKVGDNDGFVYVPRDNWKIGLMRELRNAGFDVDANAIL